MFDEANTLAQVMSSSQSSFIFTSAAALDLAKKLALENRHAQIT